ncbi:MAG: long-chain-fatty-acid--CoA ligase [Pseudomonadota bacterium]|nr:long-chain-fatty-acid--CoA ligase [Pseudomonadota bacterium]
MIELSEARTFGDVLRFNAAVRPHKVALQTLDGRSVTFGDFNERVNRLNSAVAQLGVPNGSRVAILSRNRTEYVESYGLSKSGLIVVPLNWRLTGGELTKLIAHSRPELLIVDEANRDLVERLRETWTGVRHFVLLGAARAGWLSYEALVGGGSAAEPEVTARPSDVLCVIYTSGTTGAPKGVAITHAAAIGNSRAAAAEVLQLTESDRTMAVMPLFHVGGMWYHLFASFATGCTSLILSDFEPATVIRELAAHRITNVHLVPSMIGALLAVPDAETADFSALRLLFYAASSMPAHLLQRAIQRLSSCGFVQSYGSTEAGVVTVLSPDDHRLARQPQSEHLLSSCGRPLAGRLVRIVDDTGSVLGASAVGEIELHGPDTMAAYWRDDEATRNVVRGGWLKTGDLGYLDAQGFLYIIDRKNDMMITGGENVYPTEVEGYLYRDPDVLEAAVFGVPDPQWVEKVVAAVVVKSGSQVTAEQLIARLRGQLAAYKCPKAIHFVQSLPKSAAGKILRKVLREQFG